MKERFKIIIANFKDKGHRDAFISLIDEYRRGPTGDGKALEKGAAARLLKGIENHPSSRVYFAVFKGRVAGCATCFIGFSTFHAKQLINIHDLIVTKGFRKKGAASSLLKHIEREAKRMDLCKITLEVRSDNRPALNLYCESGFGPGNQIMYFLTKSVR